MENSKNWDSPDAHYDSDDRLANGLGMFSLGLGLAEIAAPGYLAKFIGVSDDSKTRNILRAYGAREIGTGLGILAERQPATWLWGRVGGDMLDIATLGAAMTRPDADKAKLGRAIGMVLGVTALDVLCAQRLTAKDDDDYFEEQEGTAIIRTITINKDPDQVYQFWRNFENLPKFMRHLEKVETDDTGKFTRWTAKAPVGTVQWEAETVTDIPGKLISWRSLPGSTVENSGTVRFERAPGDRGTVVTVELRYTPPGGTFGTVMAKMIGEDPGMQIAHDLRNFKQIMEVGEVVESDASIHSGMHAAQPPKKAPKGEVGDQL
jgi:uncharacterized membrane protein